MGVTEAQIGMPYPDLFMKYAVGALMANLVVAPLCFALRDRWTTLRSNTGLDEAAPYIGAIGYVVAIALFLRYASADMLTLGRCLMFAPMIILTLKRGWYGAASTVAICSIALQLTQRKELEPSLVSVQCVSSAVIAAILLFGANTTQANRSVDESDSKAKALRKMVKGQTNRMEEQFRRSAAMIDEMYEAMGRAEEELKESGHRIDVVRNYWSSMKAYRNNLKNLRQTFYPYLLDKAGLRAAILSGPLSQVLNGCEVEYDAVLTGPAVELSNALQTSVYRLAYESVCVLLRAGVPERIAIRLRVGMNVRGVKYAAMSVSGSVSPAGGWRPALSVMSTGLTMDGIDLVAASFQGRVKSSDHKITMLLLDDAAHAGVDVDGFEPVAAAMPMHRGGANVIGLAFRSPER